jgi:cell shape-determining protein MreD
MKRPVAILVYAGLFLGFSWFYSNLWPLNLLLLLPFYCLLQDKTHCAWLVAFFGGLVFDLVNFFPLGLSSVVFLGLSFLFWLLIGHMEKDNMVPLTVFALSGYFFWQLIVAREVNIPTSVIFGLCFWLLNYVFYRGRSHRRQSKEIFLQ